MAKERSDAQRSRQDSEFREKGRYAKVNPCQGCGKSAGVNYSSHPLTDTENWHDAAICLCNRCYYKTCEITDVHEFYNYQKNMAKKSSKIEFSVEEAEVIFRSLEHAIQDRQTLADAYKNHPKEAMVRDCDDLVKQYRALRIKLGKKLNLDPVSEFDKLIKNAKTVDLVKFVKNKGKVK